MTEDTRNSESAVGGFQIVNYWTGTYLRPDGRIPSRREEYAGHERGQWPTVAAALAVVGDWSRDWSVKDANTGEIVAGCGASVDGTQRQRRAHA